MILGYGGLSGVFMREDSDFLCLGYALLPPIMYTQANGLSLLTLLKNEYIPARNLGFDTVDKVAARNAGTVRE